MRRKGMIGLLLILSSLLAFTAVAAPVGAQQTILWRKTWGAGSGSSDGNGVAVDSSGNIYIVGSSDSFQLAEFYFPTKVLILKYNSTGSLLWSKIWGGNGTDDEGLGIALDPSGNFVYVTGLTNSTSSRNYDLFLLKLDSSGKLQWQTTCCRTQYTSPDVLNGGLHVAVNASGDIYVAGQSTYSGGAGATALLLKFDSSGGILWERQWTAFAYDYFDGITVDSSGVYLAGTTNGVGAGFEDALVMKFSPMGDVLWEHTWGGAKSDYGEGVALDSSSNLYVVGSTTSYGAGGEDIFLLKLNSNGILQWTRTWGGSKNDYAWSYGVAVDPQGTVYVAGYGSSFGAGMDDAVFMSFNPSGSLLSQHTWGGPGTDYGDGVAVTPQGSIIVMGTVAEAPPYTLGSGNNTVGSGNNTLGTPTIAANTLTIPLRSISGTVNSVVGSETYAGSSDVFLFNYGAKPMAAHLPITSALIVTAGVGAFAMVRLLHRRGRHTSPDRAAKT